MGKWVNQIFLHATGLTGKTYNIIASTKKKKKRNLKTIHFANWVRILRLTRKNCSVKAIKNNITIYVN